MVALSYFLCSLLACSTLVWPKMRGQGKGRPGGICYSRAWPMCSFLSLWALNLCCCWSLRSWWLLRSQICSSVCLCPHLLTFPSPQISTPPVHILLVFAAPTFPHCTLPHSLPPQVTSPSLTSLWTPRRRVMRGHVRCFTELCLMTAGNYVEAVKGSAQYPRPKLQ